MTIEIRPATKDDASIISGLNADVQAIHANALPWRFKQPDGATFSPAEVETLIQRSDHIVLLAHVDDLPAGYVIAEIMQRAETGRHHAHDMVYVHQISVRPAVQKRGVGRALMDSVKAHGEALGISLIALDTWTFNEQALAFFRRYGLVPYNVRLWNRNH